MPDVLIVDDHAAVRAGVAAILSADPAIVVVGEAADAAGAVALVDRLAPDIVILDLHLPDRDGVEVCREITGSTRTRVLVLTAYELGESITAALDAGAAGFLAKTAEPRQMIDAVRAVAEGHAYLTPSVTKQVIARASGRDDRPAAAALAAAGRERADDLTARELDVLDLIARGLTNKQIAARLTISPATAKTHVARIMQKLAVTTRTQAAAVALSDPSLRPGDADRGAPTLGVRRPGPEAPPSREPTTRRR